MTAMAPPRLRIPPNLSFEQWRASTELALVGSDWSDTNLAEIDRAGGSAITLGLRLTAPVARGVLEHSGAVALAGGEPLVEWIVRDARGDSVRVLAFDPDLDLGRLATPFLAQLRRLIVQGKSAISSPWLGPLQALRWIHPPRLDAIRMPPQLRELRIAGIARAHTLDAMLALLATTNLELLELSELEVPIDALVRMPLRELHLTDCTLRGAEMFPAMPHCRVSLTRCD